MSRIELSEFNSMIVAFNCTSGFPADGLLCKQVLEKCQIPCNTEKSLRYLYQFHMIYKSIPRYQRNNAFCLSQQSYRASNFIVRAEVAILGIMARNSNINPIKSHNLEKTDPNTANSLHSLVSAASALVRMTKIQFSV